jgi:SprT protein
MEHAGGTEGTRPTCYFRRRSRPLDRTERGRSLERMKITSHIDRLRDHLPAAAYPVVVQWLRRNPVELRIVRPRTTKLGDYRSATRTQPHRVTVNEDLNKYAFLVTLIHEFAHYTTYIRNKRWTQPHGSQWKAEYHRLMRPFMSRAVFPQDVLNALAHHLEDAPSSTCTDHDLMRVLRKYDRDPRPHLEELPDRSVFRFNDRIFVKGPQLRKRFKCHCLNDRRVYYIDPLAEVHVHGPLIVRKAS